MRQRYDPPIPLGLYLVGAGATVALSFVAIALFTRKSPRRVDNPGINLLRFSIFRLLVHPGVLLVFRVVAVGLFVLIILAGIFGRQNPFKNIAPTAVWVVWWVGLAYISALVGDLWALINPWNSLFAWAERLVRLVKPGAKLSLNVPYPEWLGVWPAAALFLLFTWAELVWEQAEVPASLARAMIAYSAVTWMGMLVFGRERWLRSGELFTIFFGTLARFAPLAFCGGNPDQLRLRPFGVGLLSTGPIQFSEMAFVVLMLSTVTFDGLIETTLWTKFVDGLLSAPALYSILSTLHKKMGTLLPLIHTVALVAFPFLFLAVYMGFVRLVRLILRASDRSGQRRFSTSDLARRFVLTLVPIAIAYHLAHYLAYFLVAGQFIIPLASDPFGFGWNLLGTSLYRIDIGVVDARSVWYTAVIAIVAGHIISVCLAHVMALRLFQDSRVATKSQYPMLALMVGYTMISLWILAQPVVETGNR